jgi:Uma2 family endonuclease
MSASIHRRQFTVHDYARMRETGILTIEVADTSIDYDRDQKLPRYAASNIAEVWIIDVDQRLIEQYSQPMQGQYTQINKVLFGNTIQSKTMRQIAFTTEQIFQ